MEAGGRVNEMQAAAREEAAIKRTRNPVNEARPEAGTQFILEALMEAREGYKDGVEVVSREVV